jgi:hypothetical protein
MLQILEANNIKANTVRKPSEKRVVEMLTYIKSLKLKPKKGRPKDIASIDQVTKKINILMPAQP